MIILKISLIVLLCIVGLLAFLSLILVIPLKASIILENEKLELYIHYLFISLKLIPKKEKKKRKKKPKKEKKARKGKETEEKDKPNQKQKKKKSFNDNLKLIHKVADAVILKEDSLLKKLIIYNLDVSVIIGGDNSARIAVEYGVANALMYPLYAKLKSSLNVKKSNINIGTDFLSDDKKASIKLKVGLRPIRAVLLYIKYFM